MNRAPWTEDCQLTVGVWYGYGRATTPAGGGTGACVGPSLPGSVSGSGALAGVAAVAVTAISAVPAFIPSMFASFTALTT